MKIDEVRDGCKWWVSNEGRCILAPTQMATILLALLDEHDKSFQVDMSWDQPEAYEQWYDAHAAVERLMEEL